ncbi:hypothetical protein [Enterovibrio norvegicus]|uniref:hypothetical protein n=1 Tax=Enterovibrio norvegicus TaxID=188144 RepID=UPI00352E0C85
MSFYDVPYPEQRASNESIVVTSFLQLLRVLFALTDDEVNQANRTAIKAMVIERFTK